MASSMYNTENIVSNGIPEAAGMRIGIVVSE